MASPIESTWSHATVLIETPAGARGTGFLVGRAAPGVDQWRVFLVTNKHVLDKDPSVRCAMKNLFLHINIHKAGILVGEKVDYPLFLGGGCLWREHSDPAVDVLAIDVVPLFNAHKELANKFVPESFFADAARRNAMDITAGDEIIVVGYPSGIRQGKTNLPLIRQGIIASRIGEELHEEVQQAAGPPKTRVTRGFLIDGGTIPGSSGSPVVLKPVTGRFQGGNIMMGATEPVLLGIIAETRFAPIKTSAGTTPGFAGLGLAFEVETIVETLNRF